MARAAQRQEPGEPAHLRRPGLRPRAAIAAGGVRQRGLHLLNRRQPRSRPAESTRPVRHAALWLHRWTGIAIAGFLIVTALSGMLVAFYDELETQFIPELTTVPIPRDPSGVALPMLDPLELRDRVERLHPEAAVEWVELHREAGRTQSFGLSPAQEGAALGNDEVFVDPYRGEVVGERLHGDLAQGRRNVMPFLMTLHESLAAGDAGRTVLGIAALLWTFDCFVGLALTFPLHRRVAPATPGKAPWWRRWAPAWRIRARGASADKLVFDLHRAVSLWIWGVLLAFAWSSVGFNLGEVYRPLMRLAGSVGTTESMPSGRSQDPTASKPAILEWHAAVETAQRAMAEEARRRGFTVIRARSIAHHADQHAFEYRTLSTLDVGRKLGNTTLFIDDRSGALRSVDLPTGRSAADTLDTWLANLHTGAVGGLWMQVALAATGLLIVVVSISGVLLWRRRVVARRRSARRPARWAHREG